MTNRSRLGLVVIISNELNANDDEILNLVVVLNPNAKIKFLVAFQPTLFLFQNKKYPLSITPLLHLFVALGKIIIL